MQVLSHRKTLSGNLARTVSAEYCVFVAFLAFLILSISWYLKSPANSHGPEWFSDAGFVLNTADKLLHGQHLYSDLFYQYGPIPIEAYVAWCQLFGNSIGSLYQFAIPFVFVWWLLLFKALRKAQLAPLTVTTVLLTISLSAMRPSYLPDLSLYHVFEEILTLAAVVTWQPPEKRTVYTGLALGVIIGAMQFVRFGAASGILVGVFVLDLLCTRATWTSILKSTMPYVGAFLAVEFCLVGWLFAEYPSDIAVDVVWPYFMAHSYSAYASIDRLPHLTTVNYFVGTQMTPLICAAFAIAGLYSAIKNHTDAPATRLLLPLVAYLFYCLGYYKQVWHFYGGTWMLCLAAAPAINRLSKPYLAVFWVLILPGLLVGFKSVFAKSTSVNMIETHFPNGESLWLPTSTLAASTSLINNLQGIKSTPSRNGVMFISRRPAATVSSHFYFFYRLSQPARHSMIFPGWLRDRDFDLLPTSLARSKALVIFQDQADSKPPTDACLWEGHPYPSPSCGVLSQHLSDPVRSDEATWIFPLK